jgi:hypothetical protein
MEESKSDANIKNDVLHSDNHSRLTPEEIAKAVAHHNRHHKGDNKENAPKKSGSTKQQVGEKRK